MLRLLLALVLLSCSNKTDPAAGSGSAPPTGAALATMSDDQIVEAALTSMGQIAKLAKKHSTDCESLAKALADHAAKQKELIQAFKKISADPAKQKDIATRHGDRILAIGQETLKAIQTNCADHPAVKQLFQTLNQ